MSDQPNITLTPRQQRALRHLARRHMHRPRITRRRMFADYTSPPVGTQSIAPDKETGQAAHPLPLACNISPMPSLAELSRRGLSEACGARFNPEPTADLSAYRGGEHLHSR